MARLQTTTAVYLQSHARKFEGVQPANADREALDVLTDRQAKSMLNANDRSPAVVRSSAVMYTICVLLHR